MRGFPSRALYWLLFPLGWCLVGLVLWLGYALTCAWEACHEAD